MDAAIEQYAPSETQGDTPSVSLILPYSIDPSCLHMQVRSGSKTKNLLQFVMRKLFPTDNTSIAIEQITWNAFGDGISKAIACAEMTKRRSTVNLHEYVQIGYKRIEQIWQPVDSNVELDKLKVNKDIPSICILLSKNPLIKLNEGEI
jgi:ribonuclease P/MRP protein subunit RPP25